MDISATPSTTITTTAFRPAFQVPAPAKMPTVPVVAADKPPVAAKLDFSRITPRQLQTYLDDMLMSGRMDALDAGILSGALYNSEWEGSPDTPIDLRSRIEGTKEFHETRGDPILAVWYAGLLDRLKTMEAMSVSVSVVA